MKKPLSYELIFSLIASLAVFGFIAIFSSSSLKSHQYGTSLFLFVMKQGVGVLIAAVGGYLISKINAQTFKSLPLPLFGMSLLVLAGIFIPGVYTEAGGAYRWLHLPGFKLQFSEIAKICFIMFLAKNLSRPSQVRLSRSAFISNLIALGFTAFLLLEQPDFGSVILLGIVTLFCFFYAGAPIKALLQFCVASFITASVLIFSSPYRTKRILSFLNPWEHFQGGGFQIVQSFLSFRSGSLLGLGVGESKQKLFFLPESHTDFILAVIGEEFGLLGTLYVIGAFFLLFTLLFRLSREIIDPYLHLLSSALMLILFIQTSMNISVVFGLIPTKGVSLPFVSYGPTSLILSVTTVCLIVHCHRLDFSTRKVQC